MMNHGCGVQESARNQVIRNTLLCNWFEKLSGGPDSLARAKASDQLTYPVTSIRRELSGFIRAAHI